MDIVNSFSIPAILFLITMASGVWLSHSGRPLSGVILTIHKLIALAAVIITAIQINQIFHLSDSRVLLIFLLSLAGLCALALIATGGILSLAKPAPVFVLRVHQIAPIVAAIVLLLSILLITGRTI